MNTYLMEVDHYFGSPITFEVEAENKKDALEKGKDRVENGLQFCNCKYDSVRVIKKLRK